MDIMLLYNPNVYITLIKQIKCHRYNINVTYMECTAWLYLHNDNQGYYQIHDLYCRDMGILKLETIVYKSFDFGIFLY